MAWAAWAALAGGAVQAQENPNPAGAEQVVVTGSVLQRLPLELPYAISVVGRDALRSAGPQVNLSEAMARVPGLVVNNRNNYAQDLQISARGFGARAGFGVRGVRLYADGIPASGPDGQGQVSHFDLADAQRIEVLRGPFSVLYGNSSGGVINLITAPVLQAQAEAEVDAGSFGLRQVRATVASPLGDGWDLRLSASHFSIDGFREHSQAQRDLAQLRLGWQGERDKLVLIAGYFDQPADDPLGLKPEDFAADPQQTAPEATLYNTRKVARQSQLGASWRHAFDETGALREGQLSTYVGRRAVTQWQAIPAASQANGKHGGGVVDFDRAYDGVEGRLRWALGPVDLLTGLALDQQHDDRRGFENFITSGGTTTLGVTGAPRRDEDNRASTRDAYVQAEWPLAPGWTASAGVRSGEVRLSTDDHYINLAKGNKDDSDELSYRYTNPVLGVRWAVAPGWQLHASAARGFEAPTLGELAYRPDGAGGFNDALKPQTSRQLELGSKWRQAGWGLDLTAFSTQVDNELATLSNSGGRSTFQNVGHTRRVGLEAAGHWQLAPTWRSQLALTWLDATYRDTFTACSGTPCTTPNTTVPAGNTIAGTQPTAAWLELAWQGGRWGEWGLEARGVGQVQANDGNTASAAGYGLLAWRWRQRYALDGQRHLEVLARVDNLSDRRYAGSVIVNDANGRFLEPGAPRAVLLGLRLVGGW